MSADCPDVLALAWPDIEAIIGDLGAKIEADACPSPERLIAVSRGGMIPAVLLAHRLGIRDIEVVHATTTLNDRPNAPKTEVTLRLPQYIRPSKRPALVADDIVGSGRTLRAVSEALADRGVRTEMLTCVLNLQNWEKANSGRAEDGIRYVGRRVRQWVRFPWERP